MTQEDKQLLLKDLCARLSYGVKVRISSESDGCLHVYTTTLDIDFLHKYMLDGGYYSHGNFYKTLGFQLLPYLRPMSSVTEGEKEVLKRLSNCFVQTRVLERGRNGKIKKQISYLDNEIEEIDLFGDNDKQYNHISQQNFIDTSDFFNSRYIDYRGLIEKGLALEAPEGMYETE